MEPRFIPVLLVRDGGLVKTVKFGGGTYIGDPINAVRVFNDLQVDEILVLDISASRQGRGPDLEFLRNLAREAFMPFGYGGGVRSVEDMRSVLQIGVEKVAVNQAALDGYDLIRECSSEFGAQSVVGAFDVQSSLFGGDKVYDYLSRKRTGMDPIAHARALEAAGAGELFVNWVNRDGVMEGYDLEGIRRLGSAVHVPLVACGGAGSWEDLDKAIAAGAGGAAAGSLFVFRGKRRGVLISYPPRAETKNMGRQR